MQHSQTQLESEVQFFTSQNIRTRRLF